MHRRILSLCLLTACAATAVAQHRDPLIETLLQQTNLDTLVYYVDVLTGNRPTRRADSAYTITSRQHDHAGNTLAADFLRQTLQRFGLEVIDHVYSATGRNIIGLQRGRAADTTVVLCAHYDSRSLPPEEAAPGADDNASGTAAVLEAARLLSRLETTYTVLYALWDEEEVGLIGSKAFALEAAQTNRPILAVVNLDMIGYDGNGDGRFAIHRRPTPGDVALAEIVETLNTTYGLGLTPFLPAVATTRSDHASFWQAGYDALLIIEDFDGTGTAADFNPFYHTPDDAIAHFNLDYFHALSQLALATLAHLAGAGPSSTPIETSTGYAYTLSPNYPNPFRAATTITYTLPAPAHVTLRVYDVLGRAVATLVDAPTPPGRHDVPFHAGILPGGVYFYRIEAAAFTATKPLVVTN